MKRRFIKTHPKRERFICEDCCNSGAAWKAETPVYGDDNPVGPYDPNYLCASCKSNHDNDYVIVKGGQNDD